MAKAQQARLNASPAGQPTSWTMVRGAGKNCVAYAVSGDPGKNPDAPGAPDKPAQPAKP
jgi:hypothetical protein